jgi:hypothetical protein
MGGFGFRFGFGFGVDAFAEGTFCMRSWKRRTATATPPGNGPFVPGEHEPASTPMGAGFFMRG